MNKEQFLAFIAGEGAELFNEIATERGLVSINDDTVKAYLNSDNGKQITEDIGNKAYAKRFKQYKETEFMKDFNAEYLKKHPELSESDKKLMEIERELADYKKKEVVANNSKQLKEIATNFGLSDEVFSLIVGEDLELSKAKLEEIGAKYKSHFDTTLETKITERLGETPKPRGGTSGKQPDEIDDIWNKTMGGF
ncbi:MAG: capsid assembly scaffolding protein Gp46 family protein [Lactococcus garvieae]